MASTAKRRAADTPARPRPDRAAYMSPQECAAYAGCSVDHVRDLIERGQLRAYRLGKGRGRIRIRLADFESCFKPITPDAELAQLDR